MASQRLLIGFGPETFGLEFPHYQSIELSRAYPDFYHESPHSILLDALVSEGIPGLGVLAGCAVLACFASRRAITRGERGAPYLAAALVAGLTSGLFTCFTLSGSLYFNATVAMLVGLAVPSLESPTPSRAPLYLRIPSLALSLIAAAVFAYLAIRLTVSDVALARAKRSLDAGRIEASETAYARSERWHLAGSSDDLYFSRALAAASGTTFQQAFLIARRAAETSEERQNAWYSLAEFFAAQNDSAGMEACLRRSIDASPTWFKPHWALAQMLLLSGRRREALTEAMRAEDLDGGKDPEIAKFLQRVHHLSAASSAE
ncbi:MAG: hypothetical protein JOZ32_18295, partial [Bryobacterales bacterium]|nr:hypothetical protein [Bryobacterales bacterium]